MDVFFYEAFEEESTALRRMLGHSITFDMTPKTIQECGHKIPPARLISIRTQSVIPPAWSEQIDGVLSRSTGYDHLRAYRASIAHPLPCGYLDEYATRAVAEHAALTLAALFRKLPRQMMQFPRFERDGLTGSEFGGKHVLVVGVGRIGSQIVRLARGMGMQVRGIDIVRRHSDVEYIDRDAGLPWADAIICAMNLTEDNRGYFDRQLLHRGKRGMLFVNIARGELARTADLADLLDEGHLGGIALDVFEDESAAADALRAGRSTASEAASQILKLAERPNVILTPHNAFNTAEAVERKSEYSVRQIRHFLAHGEFVWSI